VSRNVVVEQAVDVMMTSEVGDDRAGRRHEQDHSDMVARDHAAHEMKWDVTVVSTLADSYLHATSHSAGSESKYSTLPADYILPTGCF